MADRVAWVLADATTTDWADDHDLVVVAYLQLVEAERREAVLRAFAALQSGGRFVWVAHDTSNLTEGTGGPQDQSVLMTADDVLIDLTGEEYDVVRAERVARPVGDATAYDCLVVLDTTTDAVSLSCRSYCGTVACIMSTAPDPIGTAVQRAREALDGGRPRRPGHRAPPPPRGSGAAHRRDRRGDGGGGRRRRDAALGRARSPASARTPSARGWRAPAPWRPTSPRRAG